MNSVLLRLLAAALAAVLTFEAPVPVRPGQPTEVPGLLMGMEMTQDIRACIRLGVQMELEDIDVERFGLTAEDVDVLYFEMLSSQELPWYMDRAWSYLLNDEDRVMTLIPQYLDPGTYRRDRYEQAAQEALAEAVKPGMTETQIALALHEYLAMHCAYDETLERSTEYDVLVRGSAVCQGYAEAYMDLLRRVGIECIVVTSEEMNHAWNQVKLDGAWYHVDVTWDDPTPDRAGLVLHANFLRSDEGMTDYYGWDSPHTCTDKTYDRDAFWTDVCSPILYADAQTCYLIRIGDMEYEILRRDEATGGEERLGRMDFKYPDAFAVGGRRIHFYTAGLSIDGDALYYTDVNGVRRLDLQTRKVTTVYEHNVSQTRQVLVGSFLEGDTLSLTTMDREENFHSTQVPFPAE